MVQKELTSEFTVIHKLIHEELHMKKKFFLESSVIKQTTQQNIAESLKNSKIT